MMYINHNPLSLNDFYVQGSSSIQYNPQLLAQNASSTLNPPYQQQLQPQLHLHAQKQQPTNGLYTFASQHATNPYDINRTSNAITTQQNNRSTSASSLSSVSSTSSNSSIYSTQTQPTNDAQSILNSSTGTLGVSSQNQSFNNNISLGNNLYSSYNFAYYNPQLISSYTTASGSPLQQSQQNGNIPSVNGSSSGTSITSRVNSNPTSYQNLNDKFIYNTANTTTPATASSSSAKDSSPATLSKVDQNYQLNGLPASKLATSTSTASLPTTTSTTGLSTTNQLHFSSSPVALNRQNFYSNHQYKPAPTSLAFLPTTTDLFYSDQSQLSSRSAGLNLTPSFTDLTFGTKPLQIPAFSSKTQFSVGINLKRKRRFKKPPELRNVLPKNSLMLLHEYRPNVEYRFVCQSGPIHRPMFTMCVDINEHKFEGIGKTKKDARMQAAEKALEFLVQHPEYIQKAVPASDGEKASKKLQNEENREIDDDIDNTSEPNLDDDADECPDKEESSEKRLKKSDGEDENDEGILANAISNDLNTGSVSDEEKQDKTMSELKERQQNDAFEEKDVKINL